MKYIVCYAVYCSTEIEADNPSDAAGYVDIDTGDVDDWEVTLVQDEYGNSLAY